MAFCHFCLALWWNDFCLLQLMHMYRQNFFSVLGGRIRTPVKCVLLLLSVSPTVGFTETKCNGKYILTLIHTYNYTFHQNLVRINLPMGPLLMWQLSKRGVPLTLYRFSLTLCSSLGQKVKGNLSNETKVAKNKLTGVLILPNFIENWKMFWLYKHFPQYIWVTSLPLAYNLSI